MKEKTLAIIKPDAMKAGHAGKIMDMILAAGFELAAVDRFQLTRRQAEGFYRVHHGKPFFPGLVEFMSEGPSLVLVLERECAIARWRELMGPTDPTAAPEGTVRKRYGQSLQRNAVHGSDSPETAAFEIGYFFAGITFARG